MLDDWPRIKREVEEVERLAERSAGRLSETVKRLKRELGVKNLREAVAKLKAMKRERIAAAKKWAKLVEEWGPVYEKIKEVARADKA